MVIKTKLDQDIVNLYSELLPEELQKQIFEIIFTETDEDTLLEKLIELVESNND